MSRIVVNIGKQDGLGKGRFYVLPGAAITVTTCADLDARYPRQTRRVCQKRNSVPCSRKSS
jgi:hypothetical protein